MLNKLDENNLRVSLSLFILFLIILVSIGTISAAEVYNNKDINKNIAEIRDPIKNTKYNELIIEKKPKTISESKLESGCCSVVLHVNNNSYVYGYRRDSSYAADIYLKKVKLYGIEGLKEYKTRNTYFFHTLILKNGWFISAGGSDNPQVNKYLEDLGAKMAYNKKINKTYILKAMQKVKSLGIGHFVIKSPKGKVGVAIYNRGSKLSIFRMKNGEYVSIPNSPRSFRKGNYLTKKSSPVYSGIYIAGTDVFGFSRRNIMMYSVSNIQSKIAIKNLNKTSFKTITKTKVKIWAINDNGKYVGRNTKSKYDNVFYKGKKTFGNSLSIIPNKKYIGEAILK